MKKIHWIGILLILVAVLSGCKQNDWLDWKVQNELWLLENAQKEGVVTTPTGLQYKCIQQGNPSSAKPDDYKQVVINYRGTLINGYQFDSNENYAGYTTSFVEGFQEGLKKMHELGTFEFYIPCYLGYDATTSADRGKGKGTEGSSSFIPPYSTLIFEVTLKSVN